MSKLQAVMSKVFQVPESSITDQARQGELENWDSFGTLLLVAELERAFSVKIPLEVATKLVDVPSVKEALRQRGVDPDHA